MGWADPPPRRRVEATRLFDDQANGLAAAAGIAARRGFAGGAEWMRAALGVMRAGRPPAGEARFGWLGVGKYTASAGAALAAWLAWRGLDAGGWSAGVIALLVFYAVEAQMVFLFPLALDAKPVTWRTLRASVRRAGGTLRVMATVMPVAVRMLTGGLRGWCCGCLEVLLWYEGLPAGGGETAGPRWQWGDGGPLLARRETVAVAGLARTVRLAWVSDLHLGRRTGVRTVRAVLDAVRAAPADVVVLGGDLVDGAAGLAQLQRLIRRLRAVAPVVALPGNHDCGWSEERVRAAVLAAGGEWLPTRDHVVAGTVTLATRAEDGLAWARAIARVGCVHDPAEAPVWAGRARVVLAGHLHGGQVVLGWWGGRWWPGALFYRWCGPRFELAGNTTLLVGCGVGDTLPVRWRCPREILRVELVPGAETGGAESRTSKGAVLTGFTG